MTKQQDFFNSLNAFIRDARLDAELAARLRAYFRYQALLAARACPPSRTPVAHRSMHRKSGARLRA